MDEPDRLLASQTLDALLELQKAGQGLDPQELRALARRIQPATSASFTSPARSHRSRGDAWLAICNLTQLAQSNSKSADVRTMLERAIAHVKLWQAALTALG